MKKFLHLICTGMFVWVLTSCNSGSNTANDITPADSTINNADHTKNETVKDTNAKRGDTNTAATKLP